MRNLKRALSLTLASVMLLGMMVVGSSAKGYDDVTDENNVEAIEVLQAIEVMVGDERGFGPERPVNRAEMAVVMGKLLNLDYNYYTTSCPFNDVYDWARGYVGACYARKIVSGRGDGIYDPGATVTAVEAASMLMRALGYFQYANDVADGFELSTVRQGTKIGIFDGVGSSATEPMTRNQVAQMVLNALQSDTVEPDGNTINLTTPDGTVLTGKVNYVSVTRKESFAYAINDVQASSVGSQNDGAIVELGEQLYKGELKLYDDATDPFNRPARTWEFDGKEIGTYIKKEQLKAEYTQKVTGKMLYEVLTKETIDKYDFLISIDGEVAKPILNGNKNGDQYFFNEKNIVRTNTEKVGGTGNGVLTQVFVDTENKDVYIAIINTYFAKAKNDYNEKKDEVELKVYGVEEVTATVEGASAKGLVKNVAKDDGPIGKKTEDRKLLGDDFDIKDIKKDDIFLVNVAENDIQIIADVEHIDATTINKFKNGDYVTTPDAQYDYASAALYDWDVLDKYVKDNMKDTTYNLFLDKYGYLIAIEIVEKPTNYLFLAGVDTNTTNRSAATAKGTALFLDGTSAEITIDLDDSWNIDPDVTTSTPVDEIWEKDFTSICCGLMNTWCTYTVDKNGVYTLTQVANGSIAMDASKQKTPDVLGQSWISDTTSAAGADDGAITFMGGTIDKKHVPSLGITTATSVTGSGDSTKYKTVYNDQSTIYLSASVKTIKADQALITDTDTTPDSAIIINGVDSFATGNQNVNLTAWNANKVRTNTTNGTSADVTRTSHGVYSLFDDAGFIIASVVVGDDAGTNTNYVYVVSSDMNSEAYDFDGDEYTWGRDVIVNGEYKTLIEKTSGKHPEVEKMDLGCWYEVKYKADESVKSVEKINWDNNNDTKNDYTNGREFYVGSSVSGESNKFVGHMKNVVASTTATDGTVVLSQNLTEANGNAFDFAYAINPKARFADGIEADGVKSLSHTNRTLQVETNVKDQSWGFPVAADAKIVLVQDEQVYANGQIKAPKVMENFKYYTCGEKGEGLEDLVDDLKKNDQFVGFVSAVFEGGVASSVIVWDQTPDPIDAGDNTQTNKPGGGNYKLVLGNLLVDARVYVGGKLLTADPEAIDVTYEIPANANVVVRPSANTTITSTSSGKTYIKDDIAIVPHDITDATSSTYKDSFTFKMTNNLTLGMVAADQIDDGTGTAIVEKVLVHAGPGVKLVFAASGSNPAPTINAGEQAYVNSGAHGAITATNSKGTAVIKVTSESAVSAAAAAGVGANSVTAECWFYAASVITRTDVTVGTPSISTNTYVKVGTELKNLTAASNGTVVIDVTSKNWSDEKITSYTVGDTNATLQAAYTVVMNDGVSGKLTNTSGAALPSTVYMVKNQQVYVTVAADNGTAVFDKTDGYMKAGAQWAATANAAAVTKDLNLVAGAVLTLNNSVKATYATSSVPAEVTSAWVVVPGTILSLESNGNSANDITADHGTLSESVNGGGTAKSTAKLEMDKVNTTVANA